MLSQLPAAGPAVRRAARHTRCASRSSSLGSTTLTSWLLLQERSGAVDSELVVLLSCIASACKRISSLVARAPIVGLTGVAGTSNASGDGQKPLDILANDCFIEAVRGSGRCSVLVSEEEDAPVLLSSTGGYICTFDPIDGSSNLDAAVPTGAIFGIYTEGECVIADGDGPEAVLEKCLTNVRQSGEELAAAGYCLFSSSTVFMVTVRTGVYGFTLDRLVGEFVLSHDNLKIPDPGQRIVSGNAGNVARWQPPALHSYWLSLVEAAYSFRYVGALVADGHRTLLYGGSWLSAPDASAPQGKARLLYEVAPFALPAEQAGGMAVCGLDAQTRVLSLVPASIHQRCPLFLGSTSEIQRLQAFLKAQ